VTPDHDDPGAKGALALFDLDNTLFDRAAAFRAWCTSFVERRGLPAEATEVLLELDRDGHAPRREVFIPFCAQFAPTTSPEEIEAEYRVEYPRGFLPDQQIIASLRDLRSAGWSVVIVTNGPASQIEKIERCGLTPVVDGWCISDVVGAEKPDVRIFHAAADLVGRPLEGWMVGDTASADVVGGRAAGLATIWLARGRPEPQDPTLRADVVVPSITEAFSVLAADRRHLPR
jgi:putative hydrolase of the HAD superfamily